MRRREGSVTASEIRRGEAGDVVDLLEEAAHHLAGVVLGTEALEVAHDTAERGLDIGDGGLGKIWSLLLEAAMVPGKFLTVELGDRVQRADRPIGHEAWHAGPRRETSEMQPV